MMERKQVEQKVYPVTAMEYQLLEEIGHGTSATVYSALCLPYKEVVAIKALDLEKCNDDLDVVCREAMTMTLINHPNVMKAFCSFVVEQKLWVVMPYMARGSCLHIMKSAFSNGFKENVIAAFLKEALKAIEYLHGNGYIHRDVKAGNILVDKNGIVKLADFGVSAYMFEKGDRQRSRNTFAGTLCWMAPEVMEKTHGYNSSADIWSFGITALELAHGHPPLSSFPPAKIMLTIMKNAPPRLDEDGDKVRFSKSFKEMIAMCLVKDPTQRPTAEKLLKHSFFKQAHKIDYICQHILGGLPSLEDGYKKLKSMDMARLKRQIISSDERNENSEIKHTKGISNWIFDVDDLKAQAAKIPNDTLLETIKEGDETLHQTIKDSDEFSKAGLYVHIPKDVDLGWLNGVQLPTTTTQGLKVETKNEDPLHDMVTSMVSYITNSQGSQQQLYLQKTSSSSNLNGAFVPTLAIVPYLKDALEQAIMQKDALENILRNINPNEVSISIDSQGGSKQNSSDDAFQDYSTVEIQSKRKIEYLQQIAELQSKFSTLQEEVQNFKKRNTIMEQQLNAILSKKEEEKMQREETDN